MSEVAVDKFLPANLVMVLRLFVRNSLAYRDIFSTANFHTCFYCLVTCRQLVWRM